MSSLSGTPFRHYTALSMIGRTLSHYEVVDESSPPETDGASRAAQMAGALPARSGRSTARRQTLFVAAR